MDRGGWLAAGLNGPIQNNTGRYERVGGTDDVHVHVEIGSTGNHEFDAFMLKWMRRNVHIKGAGSVQRASGEHGS